METPGGWGWPAPRGDGYGNVVASESVAWLDGTSGVILALLAATGDADADWDRALLLSAHDSELRRRMAPGRSRGSDAHPATDA